MSFDGPAYLHNVFSRLVNDFEMSQRVGPTGPLGAASCTALRPYVSATPAQSCLKPGAPDVTAVATCGAVSTGQSHG